ncbi:MAG TPA: cupredoxin family copper-binding protein [Candidatus Bilamarchaeaceae archaeon]|nr:cupredoxin family copper-binding protein [Candidatus Bilamarchaeaceae archaeon]
METKLLTLLFAIVFLFGCTTPTGSANNDTINSSSSVPNAQDTVTVNIKGFAFSPSEITVSKGTTVTWIQDDDAPHTVTADDNTFDSGSLSKGKTFSYTFDTPGTFNYHCSFHGNMRAKVVVTE